MNGALPGFPLLARGLLQARKRLRARQSEDANADTACGRDHRGLTAVAAGDPLPPFRRHRRFPAQKQGAIQDNAGCAGGDAAGRDVRADASAHPDRQARFRRARPARAQRKTRSRTSRPLRGRKESARQSRHDCGYAWASARVVTSAIATPPAWRTIAAARELVPVAGPDGMQTTVGRWPRGVQPELTRRSCAPTRMPKGRDVS